SGAPLDCNNYEITVTVDEPDNTTGWYIEYHIDGGSGIAIDDGSGFLTSSPYTFIISSTEAPAGSVIILCSAFNVTNFCLSINNNVFRTTISSLTQVTWNCFVNVKMSIVNSRSPSVFPDYYVCIIILSSSSGRDNLKSISRTFKKNALSRTILTGGQLNLFT